ncbi:sulfurtransferase TusA family protein [Emcibacter sp. SYSU 3D8]|uniref:sulfurtransferase TusA family protein n=1 Tax=Emcibacter sp. SYSU 3D8 TaxID=3133969 RepID=UPI0031FEC7F3
MKVLDATGLLCPLPVLRAQKALRDMAAGDVIDVLATDKASVAEFPAFCQQTGNELLEWEQTGGQFRFRLRKA